MERGIFEDRVCIVTGGAEGIGAAVARALAGQGARVAILDIDAGRAEARSGEIGGSLGLGCDVSDEAAVARAFDAVMQWHGRIDVLVNNAGIIADAGYGPMLVRRANALEAGQATGAVARTARMPTAEWRRMLAVHLDGTFFCTRAALGPMQERRSGAIVNLGSFIGIDGGEGVAHYAAAKAGIHGFTRAVAREVAPLGIRVNAVAPGYVETTMREEMPEALTRRQVAATPIGRLGRPEEIAEAVLYLAGDGAGFVTGQILSVNGGYLSR